MKKHIVNIGKDSLWYLIATASTALLAFIAVPIFTRVLVPYQYGIYSLIAGAVTLISALGTVWLAISVVRFYPEYESQGKLDEYYSTIYHYVPFVLAFCLLVLLPLLAIFLPASSYKWPLVLGVAVLALFWLFRVSQGLARAKRQARWYAVQVMVSDSGRYLLGAAFVGFFGLGVAGIFLGWLIALVVIVVIQLVTLSFWKYFDWNKNSKELQRKFLHFGVPLIAANVLGMALSVADRYIIQLFKGATQVGLYAVVYSLGTAVVVFLVSFIQLSSTPVVVDAYEKDGEEQAIALVRMLTRYFLVVLVPGIVGMWLLRLRIMSVVTSPKYIAGATIILPIIAGVALGEFAFLPSMAFNLKKKTKLLLWAVGMAALANIALNFALVPFYGYAAAAWVTLASYVVYLALVTILGERLMHWDFPWMMLLQVCGASAVMGAALYFLNRIHARGFFALLLLIAIGTAVYGITLLLFGGFSRNELRSAYGLALRVPLLSRLSRGRGGDGPDRKEDEG